MFEIRDHHVFLTADCAHGKAGEDLGHVADVLCNHVAAIDPAKPADSLVHQVARQVCAASAAAVAVALDEARAEHAAVVDGLNAQIQALTVELARYQDPQPDDDAAVEAAAQIRANEILTARAIEARALELVGEVGGA